jgi:hypothetical protein
VATGLQQLDYSCVLVPELLAEFLQLFLLSLHPTRSSHNETVLLVVLATRLGGDGVALSINVHHAVADGRSP